MYKDIMVYVDDCDAIGNEKNTKLVKTDKTCLLYTSDAADDPRVV